MHPKIHYYSLKLNLCKKMSLDNSCVKLQRDIHNSINSDLIFGQYLDNLVPDVLDSMRQEEDLLSPYPCHLLFSLSYFIKFFSFNMLDPLALSITTKLSTRDKRNTRQLQLKSVIKITLLTFLPVLQRNTMEPQSCKRTHDVPAFKINCKNCHQRLESMTKNISWRKNTYNVPPIHNKQYLFCYLVTLSLCNLT